jgi:hypothetical protein
MKHRHHSLLSSAVGVLLAASTVYLLGLLLAHVFGLWTVERHHVESGAYVFAVFALATALLRPGAHRQPGTPEADRSLWLFGGFLAASILLYGNAMFFGLLSDDFVLVRRSIAGEWLAEGEFVRPLPLVFWSGLLALTHSPVALHAANIVLHGLNGALVCSVGLRAGLPGTSALAAGLVFLVYPSSVEAVAWPSAIPDLLVTCAALIILLIASRPPTARGVFTALIVLACALLSKESAVVIPLLVAVVWLGLDRERRTGVWPVVLTGIGLCLAYAVVRSTLVAIPDSYYQTPSRYLLKELIARPFGTLTLPWTAAVVDARPAAPWLWAAMCVAAMAVYAWRSDRTVAVAASLRWVAAVLMAVLPVYSMLFITPDLENGRYLYLSTAFWSIAVVGFATTARGLGRGSLIGLSAALVLGVAGVQWHLGSWREAAALRERVLGSAAEVLQTAPCRPVSLAGAPDSVRGAYVFRNGLAEAIALRTAAVPADPSGDCVFLWQGEGFRRATNLALPVQATFAR